MFIISNKKNEAIYEQIINQVIKFKELGLLKPGDKLPSTRNLALELRINPNTVSKAYQELEGMGVVESLNKKGVFIKNGETQIFKDKILFSLKTILKEAMENKIDKKTVISVVDGIYGG